MTSRVVTLAGFGVLAAAAVVLEVWALRSGRVCRLVDALRAARGNRAASILLLVGWLWLGWHIFVRVDQP